MKRTIFAAAAIAVAAVTTQGALAASGTILVPDDFSATLSDTRALGHYEVEGTALNVWTSGADRAQRRVAEYVATNTPLKAVGSLTLDLTYTGGNAAPEYHVVVDFDGNGTNDGILAGEPLTQGNQWRLAGHREFGPTAQEQARAPHTDSGNGSHHGTLAEWSTAFKDAVVTAYGFSLASGGQAFWTINSISFAGTTYTFAKPVVLTSKNECKNGGWAASTSPVFASQGKCVSSFASAKKKK